MTPNDRAQKAIDHLYKAHGLSRGLDFMTEATSPIDDNAVSRFRNAVEEVNNACYEAFMIALEEVEKLQMEMRKGGAA